MSCGKEVGGAGGSVEGLERRMGPTEKTLMQKSRGRAGGNKQKNK